MARKKRKKPTRYKNLEIRILKALDKRKDGYKTTTSLAKAVGVPKQVLNYYLNKNENRTGLKRQGFVKAITYTKENGKPIEKKGGYLQRLVITDKGRKKLVQLQKEA